MYSQFDHWGESSCSYSESDYSLTSSTSEFHSSSSHHQESRTRHNSSRQYPYDLAYVKVNVDTHFDPVRRGESRRKDRLISSHRSSDIYNSAHSLAALESHNRASGLVYSSTSQDFLNESRSGTVVVHTPPKPKKRERKSRNKEKEYTSLFFNKSEPLSSQFLLGSAFHPPISSSIPYSSTGSYSNHHRGSPAQAFRSAGLPYHAPQDDQIVYQIEVDATGVETYATTTSSHGFNPGVDVAESNSHVPQVTATEYQVFRSCRRPPPSPSGQQLASSVDSARTGGQHMKQLVTQFRTLTPPSSTFLSPVSGAQHHQLGQPVGARVDPTGVTPPPVSSHQRQRPASTNAGDRLSAHDLHGLQTSSPSSNVPPSSCMTTSMTNDSILAPTPSKLILNPYVFRPVRPSRSSGNLGNAGGRSASRSPHALQGEMVLASIENEDQYKAQHAPPSYNNATSHRTSLNSLGMSGTTTPVHEIPIAPSQYHHPTSSQPGYPTSSPSQSKPLTDTGHQDLEAQLRWKDSQLAQLRNTMEVNELAMTGAYQERTKELEQQLAFERERCGLLQETLFSEGSRQKQEVGVQVSIAPSISPALNGDSGAQLAETLSLLERQGIQFQEERSRWLEEKAKVVAYQRQLQMTQLQMERKCRRLEAELAQVTLELERKDHQIVQMGELGRLVLTNHHGNTAMNGIDQQSTCYNHENRLSLPPVPPSHSNHFSGSKSDGPLTSSPGVAPSTHSHNTSVMRRSASNDVNHVNDKRSLFQRLEPEETAC